MSLVARLRSGEAPRVEQVSNAPQQDTGAALTNVFPSVTRAVVQAQAVADVVTTMLKNKWPQCLVDSPDGRFLVRLEKVVRAAEERSP